MKKIILPIIFFSLVFPLTVSSQTGKEVDKSKINLFKNKFKEINGLKIPVLTEDKKVFVETPTFKEALKKVVDFKDFIKNFDSKKFSNSSEREKEYKKESNNLFFNHLVYNNYSKNIITDKRSDGSEFIYYYNDDRTINHIKQKFIQKTDIIGRFGHKVELEYTVSMVYYPNGKLKEYRIVANSMPDNFLWDLKVGKWFWFDEDGKIIKKIDIEKHYNVKLSDIIDFALNCEEAIWKERDLIMPFRIDRVINIKNPEVFEWHLRTFCCTDISDEYRTYFYFNGKTGKVLLKTESYSENREYLSKFKF